jgi:hypothetical protein
VFVASAALAPLTRAVAQEQPTLPNPPVCYIGNGVGQTTACPPGLAPGYYFPGWGPPTSPIQWMLMSVNSPPICYPLNADSGGAGTIPCPPGLPPGFWQQGQTGWTQVFYTPLYAGSPGGLAHPPPPQYVGNPKTLNCETHPELCRLQPCPPMVVPGGNPAMPQVSEANPANRVCTRTPASTPKIDRTPKLVVSTPPPAAPGFCKANPGKCLPPAGQARSFCVLHPEQCSMPDAGKPEIDNPAAQGGVGR